MAAEDGTTVEVYLQIGRSIQVQYENNVYVGGDTILMSLNKYDTVQIQDFNDLSGTYIK